MGQINNGEPIINDGEPIEVTVTFLEMAEPPKHYAAMPSGRQLALLRAKDIPLHFYRYLQDRVGRKWHWVNALRLDDEELAAALHREDRDIRVLYLDGAPAGMFDIKPHPHQSETEIMYFGLMDHATGQGLGRWFVGAAIQAAWAQNPKTVIIQTCTLDHPAALPLYQKVGFVPVAQKKEFLRPMSFQERSISVMR
ncbi:GNAT family N-acetyltransferase [Oryzicola mucosus]|uniref:GNAT family N-acetyltransferase n=1 Tax=Oryzicola mucosus TaxID=2767425 RepID=A0A8J6PVI6_9HYPH|nr:GNAT family N-acetyltransferase [Oryzicola mucosus]MBD0415022.1 GNAT family N-acetyltransferase [Oryzicola mucosus]